MIPTALPVASARQVRYCASRVTGLLCRMTPPPYKVGAAADIVSSSRTNFVGTLILTTWNEREWEKLVACSSPVESLYQDCVLGTDSVFVCQGLSERLSMTAPLYIYRPGEVSSVLCTFPDSDPSSLISVADRRWPLLDITMLRPSDQTPVTRVHSTYLFHRHFANQEWSPV